MNPREMRYWSTARRKMTVIKQKTKQVNAGIRGRGFGSSCALAGRGAAGGEGQTDPVRLKSSSRSRALRAVSKGAS